MTVAVIGAGNIGSRLARRLAEGGVDVLLAAEDRGHAESIAQSIGNGVKAVDVSNAVSNGDQVIFATWFATTKDLLAEYKPQLVGKIVIDPSNNMAFDESGNVSSLNPEGVSAAQQLAPLVPQGAWYVKAFGTLSADMLDATVTDAGERPVLFYAADDEEAGNVVADLITKAGFDPVRAGGIEATARIEVFGDLHPFGGLKGRLVGRAEALQLIQS
jgi:8-hydroxy-5-deazaflavin:NADPH oxidoreductase